MRKQTVCVTLLTCVAALLGVAMMSNAGSLTPPPGPVAPTPGPEPRIAVNMDNTPGDDDDTPSLLKITEPGSYYLTGNILGVSGKHGIEIAASGVTLDLMGFELRGVLGSFDGVVVTTVANSVCIRNGSVREWAGEGVNAGNARNAMLDDLRAAANGLAGLRVGNGALAADCVAFANGGDGIVAGTVSTIRSCIAASNNGNGVSAASGSTIHGCTAGANKGDGIQAASDSFIVGNTCDSNGAGGSDGAGIHATGQDNRIENNAATDNDRGIDVDNSGNLIIRNSASGNTSNNYVIAAGNKVGVIVNAPSSGAITGSTGGAGVGTTDPWANFSF